MRKTVVVNSTPIIALKGINSLNILNELYGRIIIPNAVFCEVTAKDNRALTVYNWISVKPIINFTAKEMFSSALHAGEIEVILLAKEMNADIIIMDDGLARRHARYLGLTVTGTIGVLLRAKNERVISKVEPLLIKLINNGFYLSNKLYQEILYIAGECT